MNEISAESISVHLNTTVIGKPIIYLPETRSTNLVALEAAQKGATEGTVVVTGEQTSGRGRMDRTWFSPRGCLALSIIIRPEISQLAGLIMITSVAVINTVEKFTGMQAGIKWPNDVLIHGNKICGILIENVLHNNKLEHSIIGIGVNVNLEPQSLKGTSQPLTSLSHESGNEIPLDIFTAELLNNFERWYMSPAHMVFENWRRNLVTIGQNVRVIFGKQEDTGIAESVSADGSLWLRHKDGSLVQITAGDVSLRNL